MSAEFENIRIVELELSRLRRSMPTKENEPEQLYFKLSNVVKWDWVNIFENEVAAVAPELAGLVEIEEEHKNTIVLISTTLDYATIEHNLELIKKAISNTNDKYGAQLQEAFGKKQARDKQIDELAKLPI